MSRFKVLIPFSAFSENVAKQSSKVFEDWAELHIDAVVDRSDANLQGQYSNDACVFRQQAFNQFLIDFPEMSNDYVNVVNPQLNYCFGSTWRSYSSNDFNCISYGVIDDDTIAVMHKLQSAVSIEVLD
jgi:hypothetical protein